MNVIDFTVTKVLTKPWHEHFMEVEWWAVEVMATSYGRESKMTRTFATLAEAEELKEGSVFLA